jgi:hypothetical protein
MAKNKISEFSSTPSSNTDIDGINIAEGCAPSGINNAIRELMAQLKDQQTGADGDSFTVGGNLSVAGTTTLTGAATAPTPTFADSTTKIATTAFVQAALAAAYPVGSIYINAASATNPATLLGFGTWVAFGAGRVMVGLDAANAAFDTVEETGGSADAVVVSHTHTASVTDSGHRHNTTLTGVASTNESYQSQVGLTTYGTASGGYEGYYARGTSDTTQADGSTSSTATTGVSVSNSTTGSSGTNANLQPYITVYMWKRTV